MKKFSFLLWLIFTFQFVSGQNTDNATITSQNKVLKEIPQPTKKVKTKIISKLSLGLKSTSGNTNKLGVNTALNTSIIDSFKEFSLNIKYDYGKDKGVLNQREFAASFQYDHYPFAKYSPFGRAEVYTNTFKKIKMRYSALVGLKRSLLFNERSDYSISLAVQADVEEYTKSSENRKREIYRLSLRTKFQQLIMDNITLSQHFFYKPSLSDFNDYQFLSLSSLNFKVNKMISLSVNYKHDFNGRPAENVKRTDNTFSSSLSISF